MPINQNAYVDIINKEFSARILKNKNYSRRSYARDLKIHPGTLSSIMKGKRKLPQKDAPQVLAKFNLSQEDEELFLKSLELSHLSLASLQKSSITDNITILSAEELKETYNKYISDWEYRTILNICEIKNILASNTSIITNFLNIESEKIEAVIEDLRKLDMLRVDSIGKLQRVINPTYTQNDITSSTIKSSHKNIMSHASKLIDETAPSEREFQNYILKSSPEKISHAKKLIRSFSKELSFFLEEDIDRCKKKEIFIFASQLVQVTDEQ
jgi:uncharacterized protein (TIGR02147 family)